MFDCEMDSGAGNVEPRMDTNGRAEAHPTEGVKVLLVESLLLWVFIIA